ncbi:hypothetical protein PsAD14_02839 [Pseudovibrio sp. Ad14]|nr:hypothetical protein PsW74_03938 [Pseudovibrio sp. W74]KZL08519.1 hypothetical protein PsAD14_02839 [Pseudovibrio sp. Ad14]
MRLINYLWFPRLCKLQIVVLTESSGISCLFHFCENPSCPTTNIQKILFPHLPPF